MRRIPLRFWTLAAAAVMVPAVPVALGAAAGAAPAVHHPLTTAGLTSHLAVPRAGAGPAALPTTYYGAGYFSYPILTDGVSGASATFTVPTISCHSSSDDEWLLPGIWVYNSSSALSEQVDVNLNCDGGTLLEESIIEVSGVQPSSEITVNPGDVVVTSLAESGTATVGTVHDLTTGQIAQAVGAATTSDATVFVGDAGPSQFEVDFVPIFHTVPFSKVQVDSEYLSDLTPTGYNLKTKAKIQISTGALLKPGDGFVTTFKTN